MEFETLVKEAKEAGITDYGVSDHYHTRIQEADIAASRRETVYVCSNTSCNDNSCSLFMVGCGTF